MAEVAAAIGLVASIASLVDLSVKVITRLSQFTSQTTDVPESFRSLTDGLPLLTGTLRSIRARAQAGHVPDEIAKHLQRLVESISDEVRALQQCLDRTIPAAGASRVERALKALKSLAKDDKVKETISKIHNSIGVLVLHQTTQNVDTNDRILQELVELKPKVSITPLKGSSLPNDSASHADFQQKLVRLFRLEDRPSGDEPLAGTCTWSTTTKQYQQWLEDPQSAVLWLTGYAGCGKSVLTKFLVEILQKLDPLDPKAHGPDSVVLFFSCDRDRDGELGAQTLLKGLISRALGLYNSLIEVIKARYESVSFEQDPPFELLWKVFETIMQQIAHRQCFIVIDALDECEQYSSLRLLTKFLSILQRRSILPKSPTRTIKFVISGRPYIKTLWSASEATLSHYNIPLETCPEGSRNDIRLFIKHEVDLLQQLAIVSQETGIKLRMRLTELAENSFLWLKVVLEHLKSGSGYHEQDVEAQLADIPAKLQDAYARYLPSFSGDDSERQCCYLQLMMASIRPPSLEEVDLLVSANRHKVFSVSHREDPRVVEHSLRHKLGPLIRISTDAHVYFVHQTVKGYLSKKHQGPLHLAFHDDSLTEKFCHLFMAQSCINYLLHEDLSTDLFQNDGLSSATSGSPVSAGRQQVCDAEEVFGALFELRTPALREDLVCDDRTCAQIACSFPAYDYAATNWAHHFSKSENVAPKELCQAAMQLLQHDSPVTRNWYLYASDASHTQMPGLSDVDEVVLAALLNLPGRLAVLLENTNISDESLSTALFWAASKGQGGIVTLLLERGAQAGSMSALHVAIQGGFEHVVSLLLGKGGVDLNLCKFDQSPPLILAAQYNHFGILDMLLGQHGIDINQTGRSGNTAIIEAIRWSSSESITALLRHDTRVVNAIDRNGCNALIHAAKEGNEFAINKIVPLRVANIDLVDNQGRNAMSHAASRGNLLVVRRLFHAQCSVAAQDTTGRNAISWAASSNLASQRQGNAKMSVLEYLVKKCPTDADIEDENGWTPLSWTLLPPSSLDAVKILVEKGGANVNKCDNPGGKSLLSWAASDGLLQIVQYMLQECDADPNAQDRDGCAPLTYAARSGRTDVVNLLLDDKRVIVDLCDNHGRTAEAWARLNSHHGIASQVSALSAEQARHVR